MRIRRVEMTVCGWIRRAKRWRHIGDRQVRILKTLDEPKVEWIIDQKRQDKLTNRQIAESQRVSVVWIKKLWKRYKNFPTISYPMTMGRPVKGLPWRREHSAVLQAHGSHVGGATTLYSNLRKSGIDIPRKVRV